MVQMASPLFRGGGGHPDGVIPIPYKIILYEKKESGGSNVFRDQLCFG
jgi:hypothetical protein